MEKNTVIKNATQNLLARSMQDFLDRQPRIYIFPHIIFGGKKVAGSWRKAWLKIADCQPLKKIFFLKLFVILLLGDTERGLNETTFMETAKSFQ